jgi:hypothetical protein
MLAKQWQTVGNLEFREIEKCGDLRRVVFLAPENDHHHLALFADDERLDGVDLRYCGCGHDTPYRMATAAMISGIVVTNSAIAPTQTQHAKLKTSLRSWRMRVIDPVGSL